MYNLPRNVTFTCNLSTNLEDAIDLYLDNISKLKLDESKLIALNQHYGINNKIRKKIYIFYQFFSKKNNKYTDKRHFVEIKPLSQKTFISFCK